MKIEVFTQSSIKLSGKEIIYFDPFKIKNDDHDADYVFITHDHYDHFEEDSIKKIMNENTILIIPKILKKNAEEITKNYKVVDVGKHYCVGNIEFDTLPAFNVQKPFHPKEKEYVGYNVLIEKTNYYVMGDTDVLNELKDVKADVCFVPIGGTYTMDVKEAASYINDIKPKKAIPIHYGSIVGDIKLGEEFRKLINQDIDVEIHLK